MKAELTSWYELLKESPCTILQNVETKVHIDKFIKVHIVQKVHIDRSKVGTGCAIVSMAAIGERMPVNEMSKKTPNNQQLV